MSNPDDRGRDEIAEMADRFLAMEELGLEFEIDFASLTAAEQDELVSVMNGRVAHGQEKLEALVENVRILGLLFAWRQGSITALECVERIRGAVPDPLAKE
jgi:hypothetical protein